MYLDGFVLPVPTGKIDAYKAMAAGAATVWMDHGALAYREMLLDTTDKTHEMGMTFPQLAQPKDGETIVFAYILYQDKAHRDSVNAKVMADPRMDPSQFPDMPFDCNRMAYGGFTSLVEHGNG